MKLIGKILIFIQILVLLVSVTGFTIKAHSCLAMHETNYTLGYFNKQSCCSEKNFSTPKETSIQEVCCSNHEQNIQITSSFSAEKLLKLNAISSFAVINVQNPINKGIFNIYYPVDIVFTDPPPLFISNNNIRC